MEIRTRRGGTLTILYSLSGEGFDPATVASVTAKIKRSNAHKHFPERDAPAVADLVGVNPEDGTAWQLKLSADVSANLLPGWHVTSLVATLTDGTRLVEGPLWLLVEDSIL